MASSKWARFFESEVSSSSIAANDSDVEGLNTIINGIATLQPNVVRVVEWSMDYYTNRMYLTKNMIEKRTLPSYAN